jgi:hypothetical protein
MLQKSIINEGRVSGQVGGSLATPTPASGVARSQVMLGGGAGRGQSLDAATPGISEATFLNAIFFMLKNV